MYRINVFAVSQLSQHMQSVILHWIRRLDPIDDAPQIRVIRLSNLISSISNELFKYLAAATYNTGVEWSRFWKCHLDNEQFSISHQL